MTGARKSAKYLFIGGLFSKAISLIGSIILARILFPEDYGYLLIAMLVTSFIQVIGNMGFENFYLQETIKSKEHEEKILNVTFKLRLITNVLLFLIQFILSYIVELYFNQPIVGRLLRVFSLTVLIMPLSQINLYILRKRLNYKPEVYANIARDVLGTIIKIACAMAGFGVLSFAFGAVIAALGRLFIIRSYQSFKPDWSLWDKIIYKQVFYFGKHSLLAGVMAYLANQIDKILLVKFFSVNEIGNYNFSNSQANLFFTYILSPQGSLIVSYTAKYKLNSNYLYAILKKMGYAIASIMLPITVYLVVFSSDVIALVFGNKWLDSSGLFSVFLVMYCLNAITFPMMGLLTGLGFPQVLSRLSVIQVISMAIVLLGVTQFSNQIIYYAIAYSLTISVMYLVKANLGLAKLGQSIWKYLVSLRHNFIVALITLAALLFYKSIMVKSSISMLILGATIVTVISMVYHLIFSRQIFTEIMNLFTGKTQGKEKVVSTTP